MPAHHFTYIAIIFNPKSTGDAPKIAKNLYATLKSMNLGVDCILQPTKHAGDAITLAREIANEQTHPLIISVSGDGGFNEVITGAIESGNSSAICAIEPAGNANDHWRTMQQSVHLIDRISRKPTHMYPLMMSFKDGSSTPKYAHSYMGIGGHAVTANQLNTEGKNIFSELKVVLSHLLAPESFKALVNQRPLKRYEDIVMAITPGMAKLISFDDKPAPNPYFYCIIHPRQSIIHRVQKILHLVAPSAPAHKIDLKELRVTLRSKTVVQYDGETHKLPEHTVLSVRRTKEGLLTL